MNKLMMFLIIVGLSLTVLTSCEDVNNPDNPIFSGVDLGKVSRPNNNETITWGNDTLQIDVPTGAKTVVLVIFNDVKIVVDSNNQITNWDQCVGGIMTGVNGYSNSEVISWSDMATYDDTKNPPFTGSLGDQGTFRWAYWCLDDNGNIMVASPEWRND